MSNLADVREAKLTATHLLKKSKHKEGYFVSYYTKNKEKYLLAQKKYRAKLKSNQPPKPLSEFQQTKQKQLLKLLVNHRSFVPWTKLAKLFRCGYITSPKGHIRIPVPVRSLGGLKTGTLYYQNQKIGDAKLSGEVMLPNQAYYDKSEFFTYLQEKSGIEYLTIKEHFIQLKTKPKNLTENDYNTIKETLYIPVKEPP
ncbi:45_t:CDS:2 [Funneliformis geosporum]|uniref:15109_t:CDS:1 n=1 Tax=Funneliformis geosporum TaxID=1117311 RepID=A0A9W4T571_9GLOM|nr:45_t:CDS:2 [Funneliformis geosporum]CAI2192811.1 15109_t:CDS:2 [Funneliformis geosporum]